MTIPTPLPVGAVNLYLLEGDPLTLVDTGPDLTTGLAELERQLRTVGHRVEALELIVLTHEHPDHSGLASTLAGRSGAPIAGSRHLVDFLSDYPQAILEQHRAARRFLERHGVERGRATASADYMKALDKYGATVDVRLPLSDGDALLAGGRTWTVYERPGHSDSDLLLHHAGSGLVLCGDHLLPRVSSIAVMRRRERTPDGDRTRSLATLRTSLEATRALEPQLALPGHGEPVDAVAPLIAKRLAQQEQRAGAILALLDDHPVDAQWLSQRLFDGSGLREAFLTVTEILGHVDLLLDAGAVEEHRQDRTIRFSRA